MKDGGMQLKDVSAGARDWQDQCALPERFPGIPSLVPVGTPSLSVARTLVSSQENSYIPLHVQHSYSTAHCLLPQ